MRVTVWAICVGAGVLSQALAADQAPPAEEFSHDEQLLLQRTLEDLARARRAGRAVAGFVKVEQMIGQRRAGLLVVAEEAEGDGLGKLQASGLPLERLGSAAHLGGVFGREQAVYVAVARDDASGAFIQRIASGATRWRHYRSNGAG